MIDFAKTIETFREHVPAAEEQVYLLSASTGLVPDFVYDGVRRYLDDRYRRGGDSVWHYDDGDVGTLGMLQKSKEALGAILHCAPDCIAFGQSATQMFTMVTEGIDYPAGANLVTVGKGWIGNRYAWQKREAEGLSVRYVLPENGVVTAEQVIACCDEHTAAVTVNLVESTTGYRIDVNQLGTFCRQHGILLFVDAVQAVGALQVDIQRAGIDFLVGNDYKWMMNFCGTGYAYISPEVQKKIRHWGAGWMSDQDRFDTSKDHLELRKDAGRFEIGYPHADGIYGMGLVAMQAQLLGPEKVEAYVLGLADIFRQRVEETEGICCTYDIPQERRSQIVSVKIDDALHLTNEDFKAAGVAVPGLGKKSGSGESEMRLSFHYYNNQEDIDRFFAVIQAAKRQ